MSEKVNHFFTSLDLHLSMGKSPPEALVAATEDYQAVWHTDDNKTIFARAATVALNHLQSKKTENAETK